MRDLVHEDAGSLVTTRLKRRRRSQRPLLLWLLVAGALAAAMVGGWRYGRPIPATPHLASIGAFHTVLKGPGTLEARQRSVLSTTVQGRLEAVPFEVGDPVPAGTALATLEAEDAEITLAHAREQARAATHRIAEAKAQLRREEAALARAERERTRQQALHARGVISEGAHDIAEAEHDASVAGVAEARARIDRLEAELEVARQTVALRTEDVSQTVITAPYSGVVVAKSRERGDVVAPGAAILELVDPESLVLTVRLDESQMASIAPGQQAEIRFESEPERAHPAAVRRISRLVDHETREFTVELTLQSLPKNWALGQRGSAEIRVDSRDDIVSVPNRTARHRDGAPGVWVLEGGRARWTPLAFGEGSGSAVEVRSGLDGGETVLDGPRLYDGMRVELRP